MELRRALAIEAFRKICHDRNRGALHLARKCEIVCKVSASRDGINLAPQLARLLPRDQVFEPLRSSHAYSPTRLYRLLASSFNNSLTVTNSYPRVRSWAMIGAIASRVGSRP